MWNRVVLPIILASVAASVLILCAILDHRTAAAEREPVRIVIHPKHKVIHAFVVQRLNNVLFTNDTIFRLDNSNCTYDQVPQNAVVTFLRFSDDGQHVVEVHFRKPPRTRP